MTAGPLCGSWTTTRGTGQGVHVSAATVWELAIKEKLGKLSVPVDLSKKIIAQGLLTSHDPFDRIIVAQDAGAGLPLLTADHVLLNLRRDFILDASR